MRKIKINYWAILILSILFITLFLRIHYIATQETLCVQGDCIRYISTAESISSGKGFFAAEGYDFVLPPLYPLFLSVIILFFGKNILIAALIQAIISTISVYLIYLISEKIFDKYVAMLSLVIASFYAGFIRYSAQILTENNFIFLFLCFVYFLIKYKEDKKKFDLLISGVFFGLANLQRGVLVFFIPFIPFYLINYQQLINIWKIKNKKKIDRTFLVIWGSLKPVLFIVLIFFVLVFSWTIRNYVKYNAFILISSHGPANLFLAYSKYTNPTRYINTNRLKNDPDFMDIYQRNISMAQKNTIFFKEFKKIIFRYPQIIYYSGIEKFKLHWKPVIFNVFKSKLLTNLNFIENLLLSNLLLFGFLVSLWNFKKGGIIHLLLLYHSLLFSISMSVSKARGRIPIMFALIILFSYSVIIIIRVMKFLFTKKFIELIKSHRKNIKIGIGIIIGLTMLYILFFGNKNTIGNKDGIYVGSWRQINLCEEGFKYNFHIDNANKIIYATLNLFIVFEIDKWFDRITMNNRVIYDINGNRYEQKLSRRKGGWIKKRIIPSYLLTENNTIIFHQLPDCNSSHSVSVAFDKSGKRYLSIHKDGSWTKKKISGEMMIFIEYWKPIYTYFLTPN